MNVHTWYGARDLHTYSLHHRLTPCLFPFHHRRIHMQSPRASRACCETWCIKHYLCSKNNSCGHNLALKRKSKCLLWLCRRRWLLMVIIKKHYTREYALLSQQQWGRGARQSFPAGYRHEKCILTPRRTVSQVKKKVASIKCLIQQESTGKV